MRASLLVAVFVLAAGCLSHAGPAGPSGSPSSGPEAQPGELAGFKMDGSGCKELLYVAAIPVAQARPFVPAKYALLGEASGQAVAFASLKHCADLRLDGMSVGHASTGDSGVFLDMGDPAVFHYYQAWWTTDNAALETRLAALGWHALPATDDQTALGALPIGSASAHVDAAILSYAMTATFVAAPVPAANHAIGWYDTPTGTMTVDKTLDGVRLGAVPGAVFSASGEAQALLGGAPAGAALWMEYEMDGAVAYAT